MLALIPVPTLMSLKRHDLEKVRDGKASVSVLSLLDVLLSARRGPTFLRA